MPCLGGLNVEQYASHSDRDWKRPFVQAVHSYFQALWQEVHGEVNVCFQEMVDLVSEMNCGPTTYLFSYFNTLFRVTTPYF